MTIGSGCGNKTLVRIGAGNLKSVIIFAMMAFGAYLMMFTDFMYTFFLQWTSVLDVDLTESQVKTSLLKTFLFIVAIGLFGFYVGSGVGEGFRMSNKIEKEELEFNDYIKFINGEKSNVEIVGTNSGYIFYLEKENKTVQITPISGIIKSIEENK